MIATGALTGVGSGLSHAVTQLSLALFTSTAPAGSCAFILLAIFMMGAKLDGATRERLDHYLVIPIAVALVGLIASTTHLGKPVNSLYVLSGIGRSPLSNEVLASVVFAGFAWVRWLLGFSDKRRSLLKSILLIGAVCAGVLQIWFTSNAYSISTVATWNLPYTQTNQILLALAEGPLLAACTLAAARVPRRGTFERALLAVASIATGALLVSECLQYAVVGSVSTSLVAAASTIAPYYPLCIGLSTVLSAVGIAVDARSLKRTGSVSIKAGIVGSLLAVCAALIVRFGFYALYTTVGI